MFNLSKILKRSGAATLPCNLRETAGIPVLYCKSSRQQPIDRSCSLAYLLLIMSTSPLMPRPAFSPFSYRTCLEHSPLLSPSPPTMRHSLSPLLISAPRLYHTQTKNFPHFYSQSKLYIFLYMPCSEGF